MALYRDTFKDTKQFPVAYASLAVTMGLIFSLIAVDFFIDRNSIDITKLHVFDYLSKNRPLQYCLIIVFYLFHIFYYGRAVKWKSLLREFDSLERSKKRRRKLISIAVLTLAFLWFGVEVWLM